MAITDGSKARVDKTRTTPRKSSGGAARRPAASAPRPSSGGAAPARAATPAAARRRAAPAAPLRQSPVLAELLSAAKAPAKKALSADDLKPKGPAQPPGAGLGPGERGEAKPNELLSTPSSRVSKEKKRERGTVGRALKYGMTGPGIGVVEEQDHKARVDAARERAQAENARSQRLAALGSINEDTKNAIGATSNEVTLEADDIEGMTEQLSWDEYAKLSDGERGVVNWNTMLTEAVQKDLSSQASYKKMDEDKREIYDKKVGKLFGDDRGSDFIAAETLDVIRQTNIDTEGLDVDDFLNLKVAFTEEDLRLVDDTWTADTERTNEARAAYTGGGPQNPLLGNMDRHALVNDVALNTEELAMKLAKGNQLMQSFQAAAAQDRAGWATQLGGGLEGQYGGIGWGVVDDDPARTSGTEEKDQLFQTFFEGMMTAPEDDRQRLLGELNTQLQDNGDYDEFWNYVDQRVRTAEMYKAPLGAEPGGKYMGAKDFAKAYGLGG